MDANTIALPYEDKRWRIVGKTMRKHIFSPDALIESLHTLQEAFGHSGDLAVCCVAQSLRLSLSRIYGAATGHPDRNEVNEIER